MKRTLLLAATCAVAASATVLIIQNAASQPRITTTRQIQMIGAAATSQTHGAWFIDLQADRVIFCERTATAVQCQTAAIP
jgi:hypothetical protein